MREMRDRHSEYRNQAGEHEHDQGARPHGGAQRAAVLRGDPPGTELVVVAGMLVVFGRRGWL